MCRMIAATGSLEPGELRRALARMAANDNPTHDHERRALGSEWTHEDGWGCAWAAGDTLHVRHSVHSCLTDPSFEELDDLRTDLILLHARRASKPGTVAVENTHPFLVEHRGKPWAFCHNGVVHDVRRLHPATGLTPEGNMDSELLFHHVLNYMDERRPEESLLESLDLLEDYTSLHSLVAAPDRIFAVAKRHPEKSDPLYHALWEGRRPGLHVVSSEPVAEIDCEWRRIAEPSVVTMRRTLLSVPA